jgi:hypothetical protein
VNKTNGDNPRCFQFMVLVKIPRLRSLIIYMNTRQNVCDFQSGLIERVRRLHQKYNYLDLKLINYRKLRSSTRVLVRANIRIIGTVLKDTYIYWDTTPPLWKDNGCHN